MDPVLQQTTLGALARGTVTPFRTEVDDLVAMFQTLDAGTPTWHRGRARTLMRDAKLQQVAALADAWSHLAARHIATAMLLEDQQAGGAAPAKPVERRRRFFRSA